MSGAQNVAAEWQRLMKLWDSARIDYTAACRSAPDNPADATLDQARRNLTEIKQQIDSLISASASARAASADPLRFAFLDTPAERFAKPKSPKSSTSVQAFPRYSKR
jgi:hypothetical protein